MEQDSANFRDKGTEVPSLSQGKGTTGQAQNIAKGQDGLGEPVKFHGMVQDFDRCPVPSRKTKRDRAEKHVLKLKKDILKQKKDILEQKRIW